MVLTQAVAAGSVRPNVVTHVVADHRAIKLAQRVNAGHRVARLA
eukprot:SAG11_NODE_7087_length_1196_cov_1.026436_1_plen_43_part_10